MSQENQEQPKQELLVDPGIPVFHLPTPCRDNHDELGWEEGFFFQFHGIDVGIRTSESDKLQDILNKMPVQPQAIEKDPQDPFVQVQVSLKVAKELEEKGKREHNICYFAWTQLYRDTKYEPVVDHAAYFLHAYLIERSAPHLSLFGTLIEHQGKNVFIVGPARGGKSHLAQHLIEKEGAKLISDVGIILQESSPEVYAVPFGLSFLIRESKGQRPARRKFLDTPIEKEFLDWQRSYKIDHVVVCHYHKEEAKTSAEVQVSTDDVEKSAQVECSTNPLPEPSCQAITPGQTALALLQHSPQNTSKPQQLLESLARISQEARAFKLEHKGLEKIERAMILKPFEQV